MNAAPHKNRIEFSVMHFPLKPMRKGECPFRLRLNWDAVLHPHMPLVNLTAAEPTSVGRDNDVWHDGRRRLQSRIKR